MSESWLHCEKCGSWVPASENGRCASHNRAYAPLAWYCTTCHASFPDTARQSLTELLMQKPELVDEIITNIRWSVLSAQGAFGLNMRDPWERKFLSPLILAWVARVEAEQEKK